jgi:hypothetical protein
MTLHIGNAAPEVKSEETEVALHNDHAPQDLFRIMEWATPCSPWVFYGLLAWASLNAYLLSTEDTQEATLCRTQGRAADLGETFTSFTES